MPSVPFLPSVIIIAVAATVAACGPEPDQALYHQAHERAVAGRDAESEALYRQLLREHPGSRLSPEAHLALAELLFRRGDHEAALVQYRELARRYPAAKSRGYALYKQAWCLLHLDQPRQAMTAFERVIALESDGGLPAEQRRGLVREARRDLVKAFARAGDPWPAPPATYFARWGGPDRHRMLDALADTSFERGRYAEAAALYRELIASQVDSPRLCAWQRGIVRVAIMTGTRAEQVAEVQRLGAVLARLERLPDVPEGELGSCRAGLRDTLKEMALLAHKQAQKGNDPAALDIADPLYRQYLARFRAEKDSAQMTFFHAELLFALGRWPQAAEEYRRALELAPRGPNVNRAAYALVLATKNALAIDDEGQAPGLRLEPGPAGKPRVLPEVQRKMIAAFDTYLTYVSASPELVAIEYRKARTYYDHDHFHEAAPLFRAIVERHPDHELAVYAASLELDCLSEQKRSGELCARARALAAGPVAARDRELATTLRNIAAGCPGEAATPASAPR